MQSLWDRGHSREFFRPTATVSTLSSDTETAMTEVLHAKPVPGYEHVYFDRGENRIRGGFWITLTGFGIPYVHVLDYDTPGWAKSLSDLIPANLLPRLQNAELARHSGFLQPIASE
jgi:hypothetical protein